ncbi:sorbosone dehydrogenase family protein [Streptomyces phytohabitans]|uniref:PQQ-dependent sugar dehydrogenase n=1 Tax=Streptomyces phytohabitans TaxID=1150371 RepID=UPI00345B5F85
MKVRTRSSAIIGTLCVVAGLAFANASANEPADGPANSQQKAAAAVALKEVGQAENPAAGTAGPGDSVWIAERPGRVRVLGPDGLGEPVLDITDETTIDGERGLLGVAFDKDFAHFYIMFTDLEGTSTLDEFAVEDGKLNEDSRRTVLTQEQPFDNHNGGQIAFGPDGMLYIALGDGGSGGDPDGNGQKLDTLLGKILRIDPAGGGEEPYKIPDDNPFVGQEGARGEIWSYGLRNPWRFSFDAENGDLYIGDVGQSAWEEIDRQPADSKGGENYGWNQMEGNHVFREGTEPENHVPPMHEYGRDDLACSVTGGFVYRGEKLPDLKGQYLFSDYCDGTVRALQMEDGKVVGESDLGVNGGEVVSFAQGPDKELYVLDIGGTISRIDPAA